MSTGEKIAIAIGLIGAGFGVWYFTRPKWKVEILEAAKDNAGSVSRVKYRLQYGKYFLLEQWIFKGDATQIEEQNDYLATVDFNDTGLTFKVTKYDSKKGYDVTQFARAYNEKSLLSNNAGIGSLTINNTTKEALRATKYDFKRADDIREQYNAHYDTMSEKERKAKSDYIDYWEKKAERTALSLSKQLGLDYDTVIDLVFDYSHTLKALNK